MRVCAERNVVVLQELRYVSGEVGGLEEARRMSREVRHWWIGQISDERRERNDEIERLRGGGKKVNV